MGLFFNSPSTESLPWVALTSVDQLQEAIDLSDGQTFLVFKHSTRCSISSMAKKQFEAEWKVEKELCEIYYLDLLAYRGISNTLENVMGIEHQSPQVLVIKEKKVIYDASHGAISANQIKDLL
jgi:bacillithiol system protein YtxJ